MFVEISNWRIEKAQGEETDTIIPVKLIANRLSLDKDNEEILPEAFNKATVDSFLKEGIIDWHHQSVMGKTQEERARAILGKPTAFKWENKLPTVYANLTKSHPIVKDSILPHLEANQPVFGASVGGNVKKAKSVWDSEKNAIKKQISSISWDHLAIAARPYVISTGTEVSMIKAYSNPEVYVRFSDIGTFERDYDITNRGQELYKALEIGGGTDVSQLTGMDALRGQSLEGVVKRDEKALIIKLLSALKGSSIGANRKGVELFLRAEGYGQKEAKLVTNRLVEALQTIF